jgi:peptidoglycan/xylan/chitin deacetylase (PgdA/CDA1 family)
MSFHDEPRRRAGRGPERELPFRGAHLVAFGSLAAVAVAVIAIVLSSGGGQGSHPSGSSQPGPTASAKRSQASGSGSRATAQPRTATVPILVYHVINPQPPGSGAPPALYVPPQEFASQMQALKADGWHAVTLDQVEANWTRGASLGSGKPIVITFDNGYASQYTNALPMLKGLGWVGVEDLQLTGLSPADGGLTDTQIRGLVAAGWELDTQGISHADLTTLDSAALTNEVATGRQMLRTRYGVPGDWFSYPSGDYNPTVIAAVQAAGYVGATTVNAGWASPQQDRFRLPRLVVVAGTSPTQLLAQIASARSTTATPATYTGIGLA